MKEIFKRAWAQILLAFTVGILLTAYKQEWRYADFVHHVGTAFIVAAIVTAFWHLREVSEVIHKYVTSILLDYSYLTRLKLSALVELRSKAAKAILENAADNPKYKREELETWIDNLLYKRLLPGEAPSSGLYRENYVERIVVEYLTLEEALRSESLRKDGIQVTDLKSIVMRVTTTTDFTVIAPHVSDNEDPGYPVRYTAEGCGLVNFPMDRLIRVSVGNDRKSASELAAKASCDNRGQILWEAGPRAFKFENGECKIWMEIVEYKSTLREPFVLNIMGLLTRNLNVSIQQVGQGPPQVFVGQMIATPSDTITARDAAPYVAWLKYEGWLFEDHGYHFHWFEASQQDQNRVGLGSSGTICESAGAAHSNSS